MEQTIADLLSLKDDALKQALTELQRELHESSSALQGICDTIVGSRDVRRRQYAAEQLTNCLDDMNEEGRKIVKTKMLTALADEEVGQIRSAIAKIVGKLMKNDDAYEKEVMDSIENISLFEVKAEIFATITAIAPMQLSRHIKIICADTKNTANQNVLRSISNVIPYVSDKCMVYEYSRELFRAVNQEMAPCLEKIIISMLASVKGAGANVDEKTVAIQSLDNIAKNCKTRAAFSHCWKLSFDTIYNELDQPLLAIDAIGALAQFTKSWFEFNFGDAKTAVRKIFTTFARKFEETLYPSVARAILIAYNDVLKTMVHMMFIKKAQFEKKELDDLQRQAFGCISRVFLSQAPCLINIAGKNLVSFLWLVAEVFQTLQLTVQQQSYPMFIKSCLNELFIKVDIFFQSHNIISLSPVVFGLGEMILFGGEKSKDRFNQFWTILSTILDSAPEQTLKDIVCGAIARLILVNNGSVEMEPMLQKLIDLAPKTSGFSENYFVFKAFNVLLAEKNRAFIDRLGQAITKGFDVLGQNRHQNHKVQDIVLTFLQAARQSYPEVFEQNRVQGQEGVAIFDAVMKQNTP